MTYRGKENERREENRKRSAARRKVSGRVSAFLFVTAFLAGLRCLTVWDDSSATGLDVFLFIYAFVAFGVACALGISFTFNGDVHTGRWKWWLW